MIARLICMVAGHSFASPRHLYKRKCKRCAREEWLMRRTFPRTGAPEFYWKHMDWIHKP